MEMKYRSFELNEHFWGAVGKGILWTVEWLYHNWMGLIFPIMVAYSYLHASCRVAIFRYKYHDVARVIKEDLLYNALHVVGVSEKVNIHENVVAIVCHSDGTRTTVHGD